MSEGELFGIKRLPEGITFVFLFLFSEFHEVIVVLGAEYAIGVSLAEFLEVTRFGVCGLVVSGWFGVGCGLVAGHGAVVVFPVAVGCVFVVAGVSGVSGVAGFRGVGGVRWRRGCGCGFGFGGCGGVF